MKKYLIAACLTLSAAMVIGVGFAARAHAFDPFGGSSGQTVCQKVDANGNVVPVTDPDGNTSPVCTPTGSNPLVGSDGVITKIANIFAFITGVAAIVVILVSGFEYVRSGGDSAKINKAKNGILFAVIGLVVVALARALVALMVSKL